MKAFNKILCLASLAGLFLLPSCNKIEEPTNLPANQVNMTISTAAVDFDAETKTSIDGLTPSWSEGDKIGVFVNSTVNSEFSSTLSGDNKIATFSGTANLNVGDNLIYAFYPYTNYATNAYNAVRTAIPTIQSPSMTSFDPMADIMVGKPYTYNYTSGDVAIDGFQFKRIMTVVKLSFTYSGTLLGSDKVEKVTMISGEALATGAAANTNGVLAGGMVLNLTDGTHTTNDVAGGNNRTNYVSADYLPIHNFVIDAEGTCSAYFVINPLTLASGKKLTFQVNTTSHKIEKTVTLTSEKVFKAGSLQPIKVAIVDADISDFAHNLPYEITASSGANATYTDWTKKGWSMAGNQSGCTYGMRLGTKDASGSAISLPISDFTDYVKVSFRALGWSSETPKLFISLIKEDGSTFKTASKVLSNSGISSDTGITSELMNGDNALQTLVFSGATECVKVKIESTTKEESGTLRFFLSYVKVEEAQASDYNAATVVTNDATNIAGQLATLNGTFTSNDDVIEEFGFYWKKTSDESFNKETLTGSDNSKNLTGLTPETGYTFKAFIKVAGSEAFGEEKTFTTVALQTAVATTGIADEITKTGAKLYGTFDQKDGNAPSEVGFKYKQSSSSDDFTTLALAQVSYTWGVLTGLTVATEYTYKAYMIVDGVTYEGEPLTFTTLNPTLTVNSPLSLESAINSTGTLTITADAAWTAVASEGAKFTLSTTSGTGNETIIVTATEANASTTEDIVLGTVTFTLTGYPSVTATAEVKQLKAGAVATSYYTLVNSAPASWAGEYLITYTSSDNSVVNALSGISSSIGTYVSVLEYYSSARIQSNATTDAYKCTIAATSDGKYSIIIGGKYLGLTTDGNKLYSNATFKASQYEWTISVTDGVVKIASAAYPLRNIQWNNTSGQYRFTCYSSAQKSITLYKYAN